MSDVFHLGVSRPQLDGAELAIVPGDPGRVARIASAIAAASPDDPAPRQLASVREFTSTVAHLDGRPLVICSTGIGGPSTSIAVEELAQLGVRTFLRVGTTGAIQPGIRPGELIVTQASVRLDGASLHFAPMEYPAVASYECTRALAEAADATGVPWRVGITASSDTFYPGQERYDTVAGAVVPRFRGSMEEWSRLNVLNYEMETATLFTMCAVNGWRAGCVAGVLVNRVEQERPDDDLVAGAEANAIAAVLGGARRLLSE